MQNTELFSFQFIAFSEMATFGILILASEKLNTILIPQDPAPNPILNLNFQKT